MPRPTPRFDARALRLLIVGSGLGWSVAFVAIALFYQLELYGDGAMFSYAVAVQDVWAFHWHNISGRSSVFLLSLFPAESIVAATGKPWAGIISYGFLFYAAPLVGLLLTYAADRSRGRFIFVGACGSTALLCPLIFGFPTEMCMAHALFWPTLAVCHYARRTVAGTALVLAAELGLVFTHEAAVVLLVAIVATLAPRGLRDAAFVRAALCSIIVVILALLSKIVFPPDDYYAGVLLRAALHFFDPDIFKVEVVLLSFAALAAYRIILAALSMVSPARASVYSLAILVVVLSAYWLRFDHSILASSRYYLRTVLVIGTPVLGAAAALAAMTSDGLLLPRFAKLQHALTLPSDHTLRAWSGAFLVVMLIHVVETRKFVAAWTSYRTAIATLATGQSSDPRLGDPRFVSSERASSDLAPLAWFSTIPYLSIIAANFVPNRLVIDPAGNYFWLSCATATANRDAARSVPVEARELVRTYSCLHR